jgi:hypothetical protein
MPQFDQTEFDDDLLAILQRVDPDTRRIMLEMQEQNRQMVNMYTRILAVQRVITVVSVVLMVLLIANVVFWLVT